MVVGGRGEVSQNVLVQGQGIGKDEPVEPRGRPRVGWEGPGVGQDEPEGHGPPLLAREARLVAGREEARERGRVGEAVGRGASGGFPPLQGERRQVLGVGVAPIFARHRGARPAPVEEVAPRATPLTAAPPPPKPGRSIRSYSPLQVMWPTSADPA